MNREQFLPDNWYSAIYESGFSIIFQVVKDDGESFSFCRKDGVIVDSIPDGFSQIIKHGLTEPEYQ
ncbi:MAG TPA: hypothetical protein PKC55_14765 [Dysgonomonas sp.]|uniref:hypothetical protein n=1 Tax=unclassified Dysgonomonas TaxID=2630389 RepID=UPI0025BAC562|nr:MULTISPECIES: hypothetical protein [unclassified Dysgonomonas]HML66091.1 hypothetical protein [Dysgonomonas sp.]